MGRPVSGLVKKCCIRCIDCFVDNNVTRLETKRSTNPFRLPAIIRHTNVEARYIEPFDWAIANTTQTTKALLARRKRQDTRPGNLPFVSKPTEK